MSRHPHFLARSQEFAEKFGTSATASRLVCGNFYFCEEIEEKLAKQLKKPAALIIGSGYQTNITVLEALLDFRVLGKKPLVFCDRLCHASLLTSALQYANLVRFHHNDFEHLHQLLKKYENDDCQKFIVAESVYSWKVIKQTYLC